MVLGKYAGTKGPMVTHTADCAECDFRINKVPAADYPEGTLRPIYLLSGAYPRQVREDRGETWKESNLEDMPQKAEWARIGKREIIGYIPQVAHTYALLEGMYGIMNEHQVAIGESTCASKLWAAPRGSSGGKALLEASELSQIALERCDTARAAIQLMGSLAEEYGFYSAEWDTSLFGDSLPKGEGGEALTVIDKTEAWVFHIIPDDTGTSAVWVAQRVPDNHIAVVANNFIIREIEEDSDNFMYSSTIYAVAQRKGWWTPESGRLNFLKVFVPQRYHPNYCHRRVWRVFSLAAPSLVLPSTTNAFADDYPFSVEVDKQVSPETLMHWQRDHYEGTQFSTTEGLAGGPYGDPNRFDTGESLNLTAMDAKQGEFPRAISLFRTSYAIVAVAREGVPDVLSMTWLCQYAPDMSSFFPFYVATEALPSAWTRGTFHQYDTAVAWWNHAAAGNYACRFYRFTIVTVRKLQDYVTALLQASLLDVEADVTHGSIPEDMVDRITTFTIQKGAEVNSMWKDLLPELITRYRDGYVIDGLIEAEVSIKKMFYPRWWLESVGKECKPASCCFLINIYCA